MTPSSSFTSSRTVWHPRVKRSERVLVAGRVGKYFNPSVVENDVIFHEKCVVFAVDDVFAHATLFNSSPVDAWVWKHSSRMKLDLNFSPSDAIETFLFPPAEALATLENLGRGYLQLRYEVMTDPANPIGFTTLYNRFHDASDIDARIAGVEQLYREVDLLIARLREELAEEPEPLVLKRGTLGKAGKEDSKRVVVRYEYGALFEPAADDDDVDEDDDLDDDDAEEDEDIGQAASAKTRRKSGKGRHEIVAGQPLLAVRIAMFDARKRAGFEPQIQFAVMSEWALGDPPAQPEDRFTLQAYMLRRIARALTDRAGVANGSRIRTSAAARGSTGLQKGKSRKLSCSLPAGVRSVPLYSIDSAQALEHLAEQMKQMWALVTGA